MSPVTVRRRVRATPAEVWARVSDVGGHAPFVPLTTIAAPGTLRLGETFVARTGLGPLGFDDPMTITAWSPPPADPARLRLVKSGRVLAGWAEIVVREVAGGAEVAWSEEIRPRALPAALAPALTDRATTRMLARVLDGVLSGLTSLPPSGDGA